MRYESMVNRTCPLRRVVSHDVRVRTHEDGRTTEWRHESLECGHEHVTYPMGKVPKSRRCLGCSALLPWTVCYLTFNPKGEVLCISRKEDPEQFSLIGGKVDPEDGDLKTDLMGTLRRAAVREAREECGHVLNPVALYEVYRGLDYGAKGEPRAKQPFICIVFSAVALDSIEERHEGEGELRYLTPAELIRRSRFVDFDTRMFRLLGRI